MSFFRESFQFFGQDFDDWCVCFIYDDCNTNRRIASDLRKPMVGCYSRKLILEITSMIKETSDLSATLESNHETMRAAKSKLKNKSMLRNMVERVHFVPNETCGIGKCNIVSCFDAIIPSSLH